LKKREQLGSPARRGTRRIGSPLGRKSCVSEAILERITNLDDPIHEKSYQDQGHELELPITAYTLRRHATSIGAQRFKKAYTSEISKVNKAKRIQYGHMHKNKTITDWWQYIWFTDEVHCLSARLQNKAEYELRLPGSKRRLESLKETKTSGLDLKVHVAAGISYNHKGKLIFHKDSAEPSKPKPYKPSKPRKSSVQTEEEYVAAVTEFNEQSAGIEVLPKGNAMTQRFYAKEILPQHIKEIRALEARHKHRYYFQEDGDPSHGNKSTYNPAAQAKRDSDLLLLVHPPQNPDLNPIEAVWQIIKQRLRGGSWSTVAEFKEAIQREWNRVTLAQIRRRIREMRWRCEKVIDLEGGRIRSSLW
jgi:transposase